MYGVGEGQNLRLEVMMAPPVEVTDWSLTNWAGLEIELTSRYLMVKCSVPCASLPCSAHLFSTRQCA